MVASGLIPFSFSLSLPTTPLFEDYHCSLLIIVDCTCLGFFSVLPTLHSELYPHCFSFFLLNRLFCFWCCCCFNASATDLRERFLTSGFSTLHYFSTFNACTNSPALIKVFQGAGSSFLKAAWPPNTDLDSLFV